jgi:hypothetical protein
MKFPGLHTQTDKNGGDKDAQWIARLLCKDTIC